MRHRIFIAINLPEKIKNNLSSHQKEIESAFSYFGENFHPIRWVKKDNLHITLEFLGHLKEEEMEKIEKILSEISQYFPIFKIKLTEICYTPEKEKIPRMIWVKGERSDILSEIKKELDKKLKERISFKPEKREFTPHITLGRIRKWEFKAIPLDERPSLEESIDLEFIVKSLDLMESKLRRIGPEYKILNSFMLSQK